MDNKTFIKDLENFFTKESFQIIEHLLEENLRKLKPLYEERKKRKFDYGKQITTKEELEKVVETSVKEMEEFLQTRIEKPSLRLRNKGISALVKDVKASLNHSIFHKGLCYPSFNMLVNDVIRKTAYAIIIRDCYSFNPVRRCIITPLTKISEIHNTEHVHAIYHEIGHDITFQKNLYNCMDLFTNSLSPTLREGFVESLAFKMCDQKYKGEQIYPELIAKILRLKYACLHMSSVLSLSNSKVLEELPDFRNVYRDRKDADMLVRSRLRTLRTNLLLKIASDDFDLKPYQDGTAIFQIIEYKHPEENIYKEIIKNGTVPNS